MSLALAPPPRPLEVAPLAALLGIRGLPPGHAILAHPTIDARVDVRALEREALLLRYGSGVDVDALLNDRSEGTWAVQRKGAGRFVRWLAERSRCFPIDPIDVARYATSLAERGLTYNTIASAMYAVESLCRAIGVCEHVTHHHLVRKTMRNIAREYGVRPRYRKEALLPDDLRRALPHLEELACTKPLQAALELSVTSWGIATTKRGDEIAQSRLEQLDHLPGGALGYRLTIGKTLQHAGDEAYIVVGPAVDARICPVASYLRYAELARLDVPGPLFRRVSRDGSTSLRSAITKAQISAIVKRIASAAGLEPQSYSAHSLRIGGANAARLAGFSREVIKGVTRHRDDRVLDGYMRRTAYDVTTDITGRLFE